MDDDDDDDWLDLFDGQNYLYLSFYEKSLDFYRERRSQPNLAKQLFDWKQQQQQQPTIFYFGYTKPKDQRSAKKKEKFVIVYENVGFNNAIPSIRISVSDFLGKRPGEV